MFCLEKEEVSPATRKKLEKDDWRLYGIAVASSGVPGTTVTSGKAQGEIIRVEAVDGYNEFTVRWKSSRKESK